MSGGKKTGDLAVGMAGAIAVGILGWLLLRDADPVGSVWELADERSGAGDDGPGVVSA